MNVIWQQARKPSGAFGEFLASGMALTHAAYYAAAMQWIRPSATLLEIGPGCASHVNDLLRSGIEYVGIDHSIDMVRLARRAAPGIQFIHGDAATADLPCCDIALMINVIQWLDVPIKTLINTRRALSRGGVVIIGTPDRNCRRRQHFEGMPLLSSDELYSTIVCAGFREVKVVSTDMPETQYLFGVGLA